jgi:hypothetical protein
MLFTEACKEHIRKSFCSKIYTDPGSIKKDEPSDSKSKSQNSFVLKIAIEKQLNSLKQEKDEESYSVPNGLITFLESEKFSNFLQALLEYCRELFRLENK